MENKNKTAGSLNNLLENLYVVILVFYPLRHISWGIDLWDTGYNYANFTYMGTEHMDPMWLFSTYLATAVGHLITKLPNAGSLMGMNLYTGLFVSLLALIGYLFSTRTLKMPAWAAFAGEMAAISLCWCPTALLYNYLTYVLFLGAVIFLYFGLTKERKGFLIAAGVCLGTNVFVRFSNLPEAAMIVAVWAWDALAACPPHARSDGGAKKVRERGGRPAAGNGQAEAKTSGFLGRTLAHTGWCLSGYLAALFVWLGHIGLKYGLGEYITGIGRLFAMTDEATDYTAKSMLMGVVGTYVENLYWVLRIGVIIVFGMVVCGLIGQITKILSRDLSNQKSAALSDMGKRTRVFSALFSAALGAAMLVWLYRRGFCSFAFYSYDSILRPGILFLMLTMLTALIRILHPGAAKEEKLLSGLLLLVVLLTSIGSNNGVYPSMNNLFLAAPYTLWEAYRFFRLPFEKKLYPDKKKENLTVIIFSAPAKAVLAAFLLMCAVQFGGFGLDFVFAEATGVQDISGTVENNEILRNIKMSPDKAEAMTGLTAYVKENGLQGQEVILYGQIPSLSYYLQMPSAFNPWSDLASYDIEVMANKMAQLSGETPVIIVGDSYDLWEEGRVTATVNDGTSSENALKIQEDPKWELIVGFMEENGYRLAFQNEKFALYRAE